MNRPIFRDFREHVTAYAQSVGSPLGTCVANIPALSGLANLATQNLLLDPMQPDDGWWGTWVKMVFNLTPDRRSALFSVPTNIARVMLMDVCKHPTRVQNGFFEFLDFGIGLQPNPHRCGGAYLQAYDRDFIPTLGKLATTPQNLQIFATDARDAGRTVIIQGTDQNGKTILGTDPVTSQTILGEWVTLSLPFSVTLNQFSSITGIVKDSTNGPVTFLQVDPVTAGVAPLSSMEPGETSAAYRTYLVNNLPCNTCPGTDGPIQVTAMCKVDYSPVASDSDFLVIPCVPALMAECEAIRFFAMDSVKSQQMGTARHAQALQLLFGQLDHYLGKERPAINVPIFGSDRLRTQPI